MSCLTVLEARSPKLRCQQGCAPSGLSGRICSRLSLSASLVLWHSHLPCLHIIFLKGQGSYWIKGPSDSSVPSSSLITSTSTRLQIQVTLWVCWEAGTDVLGEEYIGYGPLNEGTQATRRQLLQHPSSCFGEVKPTGLFWLKAPF